MYRTPVCCTAYTSPADLWLQLRWDGGRELKDLMLRATSWAAAATGAASRGGHDVIGRDHDWVLARPDGQPLWFRARIVKAAAAAAATTAEQLGQQAVTAVRLVDFGDRLEVNSLVPMPENFVQPPGFAIRCKLARLSDPPGGRWPQADAKLLERLVTMATEDMILEAEIDWRSYVNEEEPLPVELYQCSGQSINDIFGQRTGRLVKGRPATSGFINSWCPRLQAPPPAAAGATKARRLPEERQQQEAPKFSWDPFEGGICHVTDKGTVFVHTVENEKLLGGLQSQLELFRESVDLHKFSAHSLPAKDEIVAVFQQQQPAYHYRGRMVENLGDRARLFIVDFGFELIARWDQCARIPTRIRYKPQCRPFEPTGLERVPAGVSLKALWEAAGPAVKSTKVTVTPIEEASGPELQAADIDLHQPDGRDPIGLVDALLSSCAEGSQKLSYRLCRAEIAWDVDNIVSATCTHVDQSQAANGGGIVAYFQPDSMQETASRVQMLLSQMTGASLQAIRAATDAKVSTPVVVEMDDGCLRRGVVDRCDDGAAGLTCDLTYVDTGAQALGVSMAKVYAVPEDIASLPTTCVKCALLPAKDGSGGVGSVKAGDRRLFTIAGLADGAYQVSILGSG